MLKSQLGWPGLALLVAGLRLCPGWPALQALDLVLFFFLGLYSLVAVLPRYVVAVIPVALVAAAASAAGWLERLGWTEPRPRAAQGPGARPAGCCGALAFTVAAFLYALGTAALLRELCQPKGFEARLQAEQGWQAVAAGSAGKARGAFERAIAVVPRLVEARVGLAVAAALSDSPDAAARLRDGLLALHRPWTPYVDDERLALASAFFEARARYFESRGRGPAALSDRLRARRLRRALQYPLAARSNG